MSRDVADDATVFEASADGDERRGAGIAAAGGAGRGAGETEEAPGAGARVLAGSKTADVFEAPEKSAGGEAGRTGEA